MADTRAILFELCTGTLAGCTVAAAGGAARVELCSKLAEDGVTPSHALIAAAIRAAQLPVHVLIRPRTGNFCYAEAEITPMIEAIRHCAELGAAGVVFGALTAEQGIHIAHTQRLIQAAGGLEITFHRAFDATASLPRALETLIELGCQRVLTAGGEADVVAGAASLQRLIAQAAGRIDVAVGGGLRLNNAAAVRRITGATHFHGSLREPDAHAHSEPDAARVRRMIDVLQNA